MIYREGDDQSPLFQRAVEQRNEPMSEADKGGYIVGFNPNLKASEMHEMGDMPVSAKGIRKGQEALHWKNKYPGMWGSNG
jgi:hypothetical protein